MLLLSFIASLKPKVSGLLTSPFRMMEVAKGTQQPCCKAIQRRCHRALCCNCVLVEVISETDRSRTISSGATRNVLDWCAFCFCNLWYNCRNTYFLVAFVCRRLNRSRRRLKEFDRRWRRRSRIDWREWLWRYLPWTQQQGRERSRRHFWVWSCNFLPWRLQRG
jgi:hypothetical protein